MTVIALPSTFRPESFSMYLSTNQRSFASPFGGSEKVVDMLNDRWMATVALPKGPQDVVASREAFVNALRGMANTVMLHHYARPVPRGNMRGSPTLAAGAAKGAAALSIQSVAGATLRAGDMIGVDGLLLQAAQDIAADGAGVLVLSIANRLRRALAGGAAVVWDRPKAPFRLVTSGAAFVYLTGYAEGVSLDFVEAIS